MGLKCFGGAVHGRGPSDIITLSLCRSEVSRLEEELRKITAALLDEFLEPERNNLIRRCV